MKRIIFIIALNLLINTGFSQENPRLWDDTRSEQWPQQCDKVTIISSIDGEEQPAYFFKASGDDPRPLVISLHTWSGGYDQKDTLSWRCIEKNYNYIHPHFRGPNNTFEACGSPLVISDIDDAIHYALAHANVDPHNIHVIGTSGGGHATFLAYMQSRHNITSFSSWAGISNLVDWYYESEGRKNKYSRDIALATTGKDFGSDQYYFNEKEAIKRSPFFMETPAEKRKNSKLFIYTGVHDGYTGSVPITQSINFYNKLAGDSDPKATEALVDTSEIIKLLTYRGLPDKQKDTIGGRAIHLQRSLSRKLQITVFEGTHECLTDVALNHIDNHAIMVIGDSNSAIEHNWVTQLQKIRFPDLIYNTGISGNTIGFDNLGRKKLNALRNVDGFMDRASQKMHSLDAVIIMLGTNDCKKVYADSLETVLNNMKTLIEKIKTHPVYKQFQPQIFIVSPPPQGPDSMLLEKYHGGSERVKYLVQQFADLADSENCIYIDIYSRLSENFLNLTLDGIHLNPEGQRIVAETVDEVLTNYFHNK